MKNILYLLGFLTLGAFVIVLLPSSGDLTLDENPTAVLGNLEPIDRFQRLSNIKWQQSISADEVNYVRQSLRSEYDFVRDEALEVVAVHDLSQLKGSLVHPDFPESAQAFAKLLETGLSSNKKATNKYLLGQLKTLKTNDGAHGRKGTAGLIQSVLVTSESKALRQKAPATAKLKSVALSGLSQLLLDYSKQPDQQAISTLLTQMQKVQQVSDLEMNWVEVLRTYRQQPIAPALQLIEDKAALASITDYGRFLIVRYLMDQYVLLDAADKTKLAAILDNPTFVNNYFSKPTSLKILTRLLRERLSPQNYPPPTPGQSKIAPAENQEELDSIQRAIDSEPKKPKFTRPEDRGQQYDNFQKADLFNKLVAPDKIDQRKAAIELGNRLLEGQLQISPQEQSIVNTLVQQYIDDSTDHDVRVREEGKLQIHRLWQLALPSLIENLHNENPTKLELAAKSLILMRNEEAVLGLIDKIETAPNTAIRKRLLFVLSKMQEQRTTVVANRACMNEKDSKELYDRLLLPVAQKYGR